MQNSHIIVYLAYSTEYSFIEHKLPNYNYKDYFVLAGVNGEWMVKKRKF